MPTVNLSPGDFEGFKKQSRPNIEELEEWVNQGYKIVVTGPPTCSLTCKKNIQIIWFSSAIKFF